LEAKDLHVNDPARYDRYKPLAAATVAAYDGRYLARGGAVEVLEGEWQPGRLVILEFPDVERAKARLESPEYKEARALRQATARSNRVGMAGAVSAASY
jgi:uncharacterized protein (DUF1330 family)